MSEKLKIPVTNPQHLIDLGITHGLLLALESLEKLDGCEKLTGVGVARHAIRAAEAEQRIQVMMRNIRLAVANNVDLDKNRLLWEGRAEVIVEPMDLVDQAEGKAT